MASAAEKFRILVEKRRKNSTLREMGLGCREVAARVHCSVGAVSEITKKVSADR